ncbi:MAG: M57 family metalloprotease [Ginsengibacter sp.]
MKLISKTLCAILCLSMIITSCKREALTTPSNQISPAILSQIAAQGFDAEGVRKVDNGYLVEGDIVLTDENLSRPSTSPNLVIASVEQYRTNYLVKSLPRVITVSVSGTLVGLKVWSDAANAMISRYNAQNLQVTFSRITTGVGNVDIVGFDQGPSGGYITLGSSGFPDASGNPYNQIKMNTNVQAYGSNPNLTYVTNVLQHEMGHCIGFRHTDYFDRSLSCGGHKSNERAGTIGAVLIPGTPSGFDSESFMLACSNGGKTDRTFNANDIIALNYLY